ncbi:hypothetical protein ONE63_001175 [Megalurothrips usitatus]|uniref:NADH dehydrogenase subunit 6 n=1 Tax=Megalurothrips usitatus TaxID=439358 RepID=A0AAV7XIJ1_9NEOP|nr:hypothetical protein ONE63_001175 [Megalurothrips usitatus]
MMVAMTAMLVSVAELSNIFSVFVVLICLCGMVLFIMRNMMVFRVHGEDMMFGSSVHPVSPRIPQVKMMKVHIPFTFKLIESSKSSYSGESTFLHCGGLPLHFALRSALLWLLFNEWGGERNYCPATDVGAEASAPRGLV